MRYYALMFVVLTPALSPGQGPPAWKFVAGDTFLLQRNTQSEQVMTVKERPFKQVVERTSLFRFEVTHVDDGGVTLKTRIESIQVQHVAGKASVESKLQEKMRGAVFTLAATRQGRIKKLDGYDELVAQVAEKKEELAKVVRQLWPAELVQQELEEMLAVVPERTVAVGETWEETSTMLVPPLGNFLLARTNKYVENDRAGHAHLAGTFTGKYRSTATAGGNFRVVKGDLSLARGRWECVFDRERGRPMRMHKQFELQGPLTIEVMGMLSSADLVVRVDVTTRLVTKEP